MVVLVELWNNLMEQSMRPETRLPEPASNHAESAESARTELSSPSRVAAAILRALEERRLVPGQRLIETELAIQFGVGRNAVREAVKQLAERGVVELARNRSPAIRILTREEALEVLDVAEVMSGLLAGLAASHFERERHGQRVRSVKARFAGCRKQRDVASFNELRRDFYRLLLDLAGNRELRRLFSTIRMEILHAQYQSAHWQQIRVEDYQAICAAVLLRDNAAASAAAKRHVRHIRQIVEEFAMGPDSRSG
jgi:DNA-binding GntR family transcriptional regulator